MTIRQVTPDELELIRLALAARYHSDDYILDRIPTLACEEIMLRENYISDGPGFAGNLAVIFWGEPCFLTVIGTSDSAWRTIEVEV